MIGCRQLTDEEVRSVSSALGLRDRCLFIVGIRSGFRIGELLSLNVSDVFDGTSVLECIKVSRAYVKGQTASRTVPMHPEVAALIREYLDAYPVRKLEYPLFRTNPVRRMDKSTFHKALKLACTRASIRAERVSSHSMRKTFADRMNKALNGNIYELQHAMGHKNISSTARYIAVDSSKVWDAIKKAK